MYVIPVLYVFVSTVQFRYDSIGIRCVRIWDIVFRADIFVAIIVAVYSSKFLANHSFFLFIRSCAWSINIAVCCRFVRVRYFPLIVDVSESGCPQSHSVSVWNLFRCLYFDDTFGLFVLRAALVRGRMRPPTILTERYLFFSFLVFCWTLFVRMVLRTHGTLQSRVTSVRCMAIALAMITTSWFWNVQGDAMSSPSKINKFRDFILEEQDDLPCVDNLPFNFSSISLFLLALTPSACSISSIEISTSTSKIIPWFGRFEMILDFSYGLVQLTWYPAMNWVSINISLSRLSRHVMRRLLFDCLIFGIRWRISWSSLNTLEGLTLVISTCVPLTYMYISFVSDNFSWISKVSMDTIPVFRSISWESGWTSSPFLLSGCNFCQDSISFLPKVAASLAIHLLRIHILKILTNSHSFTLLSIWVTCSILSEMGRLDRVFIRSRPISSSTAFDKTIVSNLLPIDIVSSINSEFSSSPEFSSESSSELSSDSSGSCMFKQSFVSAISRFSISSLVSRRGFVSTFSFSFSLGLMTSFEPPLAGLCPSLFISVSGGVLATLFGVSTKPVAYSSSQSRLFSALGSCFPIVPRFDNPVSDFFNFSFSWVEILPVVLFPLSFLATYAFVLFDRVIINQSTFGY